MPRFGRVSVGLALVLGVSACVSSTENDSKIATSQPTLARAQAVTTFDIDVSGNAVGSCQGELVGQTGQDVEVIGTQFTAPTTATVYLQMIETGAQWRCVANNDGTVASLMPI